MHILQTTLTKFLSLKNTKKLMNRKKFLSYKNLSKHLKVRKDDIGEIMSKLEWIEHSNGYVIITAKGEKHCAPKYLVEEIEREEDILWKDTILKDENFINEANILIDSFNISKIS